ncbi:hypothetical protein KY285_033512 [Solanum tuberosum]|nr:hypothetical protein KY285_033512 [Solanum tuberosum]
MPSQVETQKHTICSRNCLRSIPMWIPWHCLGSDAEIATLENLGTPPIGNATSIKSDLVLEPSSITEGQVFDEISHTTVSSSIPELNFRFCKDVTMQIKDPTSVLNETKGPNSMEEENSLDNAALFNKSL